MESVKKLFHDFVLHHERTIVFGNLGRYPKIIFDVLQSIPHLNITVISPYYPFITSDPRIRVINSINSIERCDLLIYLEPISMQPIQKHSLVSHVAVFTSHFTFKTFPNDFWVYVSYFYTNDIEDYITKTKKLLDLQDPTLETPDANLIGVDFQSVHITKGSTTSTPPATKSYIIIDLTEYKKDTLSMYLAFWDKFDYMLEHFDNVHRWFICFADSNGRHAFERFTQKCIDTLFCKNFEHGNVTKIQKILSLIPYYKSGIIDKNFEIPILSVGGMKIVIPKTMEDACKAAIMYDLDHLTKNVYLVRE